MKILSHSVIGSLLRFFLLPGSILKKSVFKKKLSLNKKSVFLKKSIFKKKYLLKKLSKSGDDSIFTLHEDHHTGANIESSPLSDHIFKRNFL